MANEKAPLPSRRKSPAFNGKKQTHLYNGNGNNHDHDDDHEHDTDGGHHRPPDPAKPTKKGKGGKVNWLSHWEFTHQKDRKTRKNVKKPVIIVFPSQNCTEEEFKALVINYLKSWLEMFNIYKPVGKRHTLLLDKMNFRFIKTKGTVKVKAFLDPDPEEKDDTSNNSKKNKKKKKKGPSKGGGHLIPPEPPPPPPGSDIK